MSTEEQVQACIEYFKQSEKSREDFLIGAELEYFIVDENTKKSIDFFGEKGIESLLRKLVRIGFTAETENDHLVGVHNDKLAITLEPGSQWEISLHPQTNVQKLENNFWEFMSILEPILAAREQQLYSAGYLPKSSIQEINFLPKQRYKFMSDYLKNTGKLAHNMMKGTASIQVAVDFCDERDFVHKMRLASRLTPIFSSIYDNANIFEGEIYEDHCLRTKIWNNCDDERCGIIPAVFEADFGYAKYVEYILNLKPILIVQNDQTIPVTKPFSEVFCLQENTEQQLDHIFSMCFPDVRARKYIELRMTDSLPYPLNFAFIELIHLIFNLPENFELIDNMLNKIGLAEINAAKNGIIKNGIEELYAGKTIQSHFRDIMQIVKDGKFQRWNHQLAATGIIPRHIKQKGAKLASPDIC